MSPSATNYTALVSTQVIRKLELAEDFSISPEQIVKYCDDALQVAEANEELHRATRIFNTMTSAVKRTLKIYLKKRKNMVFELPEDLKDLDLTDDDNWKKVQDWELDWLQKLRASVAQDTVQTVLEAAAEISLGAIPGTMLTSKQVLSYIGRVTALLDSLSATTTKELKPKALNSALMRKWPSALRHLMEDTAKPDEDWEEMLERLSEFCADAQNSLPIISALTIPVPTPSKSSQKRLAEAMFAPAPKAPRSAGHQGEEKPQDEEQDAEKQQIRESAKNYTDLEYLLCRGCGKKFTWTAGEQSFYTSKNLTGPPKSCKDCRIAAKRAAEGTPTKSSSLGSATKSGFGSSGWGKQT